MFVTMENWNMIALQALSVSFGIFMLYVARIHRRKALIDKAESNVWTVLWVLFIVAAIFPESVRGLVETFKITRVFDFFVIIAFMILSYLTYQTRLSFRKMEQKLEQAVRKEAIHAVKQSTR